MVCTEPDCLAGRLPTKRTRSTPMALPTRWVGRACRTALILNCRKVNQHGVDGSQCSLIGLSGEPLARRAHRIRAEVYRDPKIWERISCVLLILDHTVKAFENANAFYSGYVYRVWWEALAAGKRERDQGEYWWKYSVVPPIVGVPPENTLEGQQ